MPQAVAAYEPQAAAFYFGLEMGTGLRTYSPTGAPHVLLFAVGALGGILPLLVAGFGFGLSRGFAAWMAVSDDRVWVWNYASHERRVATLGIIGSCTPLMLLL